MFEASDVQASEAKLSPLGEPTESKAAAPKCRQQLKLVHSHLTCTWIGRRLQRIQLDSIVVAAV